MVADTVAAVHCATDCDSLPGTAVRAPGLRGGSACLPTAQCRLVPFRHGLKIPSTLLTDNPSVAREFCEVDDREIVYKSLSAANLVDGENVALVFTTRVSAEDVDTPDVAVTMNMFQEWVSKSCDVRVTVFGSR